MWERSRRMLSITCDAGEVLAVPVRATRPRPELEIGTSNGYSTVWPAEAAKATGGSVTTVELSDYKAGLAAATFARSRLGSIISLVHEDAGCVLERAEAGAFDFIFLDAEQAQYLRSWPHLLLVTKAKPLRVVNIWPLAAAPANMSPSAA